MAQPAVGTFDVSVLSRYARLDEFETARRSLPQAASARLRNSGPLSRTRLWQPYLASDAVQHSRHRRPPSEVSTPIAGHSRVVIHDRQPANHFPAAHAIIHKADRLSLIWPHRSGVRQCAFQRIRRCCRTRMANPSLGYGRYTPSSLIPDCPSIAVNRAFAMPDDIRACLRSTFWKNSHFRCHSSRGQAVGKRAVFHSEQVGGFRDDDRGRGFESFCRNHTGRYGLTVER